MEVQKCKVEFDGGVKMNKRYRVPAPVAVVEGILVVIFDFI